MSKLYIIFYDKLESCFLSSVTNQILPICGNGDKIYHLINKEDFKDKSLASYNKLYQANENINKVFIYDFNAPIKDFLRNEIQKYENIIIFSGRLSFNNKISDFFKKNSTQYLIPENNKDIAIAVYSRSNVIELMRTDATINTIKDMHPTSSNTTSIVLDCLIDNKKIENIDPEPEPSMYYEDQNCLFCILGTRDNITRSAVYFNKNNQKIYNITNNIFGNVMKYSDTFLSVDWKIDNQNKACYYNKHNGNFDN